MVNQNSYAYSQPLAEKEFLWNSVTKDLNHYKPRWIIVDFWNFGSGGYLLFEFNKHDAKFHAAWQHYKYAMTIDHYWIYERKDNGIMSL